MRMFLCLASWLELSISSGSSFLRPWDPPGAAGPEVEGPLLIRVWKGLVLGDERKN